VEDLLKQITDKFGISADQAKEIVGHVAEFLGDKLPGPIGDQVKKLLGGGGDDNGDDDDDGGGLLEKAKDLFGG
jgi:hypothetical protein